MWIIGWSWWDWSAFDSLFACPNQNGVWNLIERTWTLECWVFWVSHILAISALNFIYNTEVVINPVTVAPSVISFSIPVFFFCLKDFLFSFFSLYFVDKCSWIDFHSSFSVGESWIQGMVAVNCSFVWRTFLWRGNLLGVAACWKGKLSLKLDLSENDYEQHLMNIEAENW